MKFTLDAIANGWVVTAVPLQQTRYSEGAESPATLLPPVMPIQLHALDLEAACRIAQSLGRAMKQGANESDPWKAFR